MRMVLYLAWHCWPPSSLVSIRSPTFGIEMPQTCLRIGWDEKILPVIFKSGFLVCVCYFWWCVLIYFCDFCRFCFFFFRFVFLLFLTFVCSVLPFEGWPAAFIACMFVRTYEHHRWNWKIINVLFMKDGWKQYSMDQLTLAGCLVDAFLAIGFWPFTD